MKRSSALLLSVLLVACTRDNPEETAVSAPAPPPAAAFAAMRGAVSLERTLVLLEQELTAALEEGDLPDRLMRAEAITDRLLETQLPFAWLTARAYAVEPLLRQIQSLADRVVAELRSGVHPEQIQRDVADLRAKVRDVRTALRAGGGAPPPRLDSLLAAYAADSLLQLADQGE